jgi:hypothetical protein
MLVTGIDRTSDRGCSSEVDSCNGGLWKTKIQDISLEMVLRDISQASHKYIYAS